MRVLGDFATQALTQASELRAALSDARCEVDAIRATTTWRIRNHALPILRAVRRVVPRRR